MYLSVYWVCFASINSEEEKIVDLCVTATFEGVVVEVKTGLKKKKGVIWFSFEGKKKKKKKKWITTMISKVSLLSFFLFFPLWCDLVLKCMILFLGFSCFIVFWEFFCNFFEINASFFFLPWNGFLLDFKFFLMGELLQLWNGCAWIFLFLLILVVGFVFVL